MGHRHRFIELARTHAPPAPYAATLTTNDGEVLERALHGCTTFVLRCEDESCGELKKLVALGSATAQEPTLKGATRALEKHAGAVAMVLKNRAGPMGGTIDLVSARARVDAVIEAALIAAGDPR